jgi:ammonia channel protein AmtB
MCGSGMSGTMGNAPIFVFIDVDTAQWFLFGYGLAFSPRATSLDWTWWGGASGLAFEDVGLQPVRSSQGGPALPRLVYAFYQEMFACFT